MDSTRLSTVMGVIFCAVALGGCAQPVAEAGSPQAPTTTGAVSAGCDGLGRLSDVCGVRFRSTAVVGAPSTDHELTPLEVSLESLPGDRAENGGAHVGVRMGTYLSLPVSVGDAVITPLGSGSETLNEPLDPGVRQRDDWLRTRFLTEPLDYTISADRTTLTLSNKAGSITLRSN